MYQTREEVEAEIAKLKAALDKSQDIGECIDIKDEIKSLELLLEYGE
jgi:hypothetical protein